MCLLFFFFKQKTAYEMRISDWSSDVCSSDLSASWRSRGRRERKLRDRDEHLRSVAEFHHIASDHRSAGRRERTARYIVKRATRLDRKSGVEGKSVSVRVDLGGRRIIKNKQHKL